MWNITQSGKEINMKSQIPEFTTDRLLCYLETGEGQESLDKLYENLKLLIEDSNHVKPFAATRGG